MSKTLFILLLLPLLAQAQEKLETIEVTEKKENSFFEFWEENKGAKIFSGKKNTVTNLKEIPQLQTNNYRQATSQTPGLLISEVPNESLAAITYRGLGDPHESYEMLLLQDGIPVAADMYGYPAHYYSPALPMMEKVQFIRGGASLLYGPQPGGVLNYISHPLKQDQPLSGRVNLTGGSNELLATNNAVFGSMGKNAFGVEYYRRQGEGPQRVNSDFAADYVQARNHYFAGKNTYKINFNGYNSEHGESGGFAKEAGPNRNVFGDDQGRATKQHDRLKVARVQLLGGVESKLDDTSELHVNLWASAYRRYSKRQNYQSGSPTFGAFPDANTNTIVTQNYLGYYGEIRYLKNYKFAGNESTFTAGYLNYNLISPLTSERGPTADANSGDVTNRLERTTHTNSLFVENRFSFGRLMVTPGVRLENIRQTIEERKNTTTGVLREEDRTANVPLFGLGIAYHLTDEAQVYANVTESYKPVTFAEAIPLGPANTISEDIDPAKILTSELGYRGQTQLLNWDASVFHIRYDNKFGKVGTGTTTRYQNTGAGENRGVDLATELKLSNMATRFQPAGDFNLYGNISILDARYTRGPLKDNTPMYAPKTITRVGLIHSRENLYKVALMSVMVGRHYGDDANTEEREIAPYTIFDLTADIHYGQNWMLSAGVLNLLDREYYSRVRDDGVAWALGRNIYVGGTYKF